MTVEVSPESRREHLVALTPAGTKLVRRGDRLVDGEQLATMPALSKSDLAATLRVLRAVNAALDA